MKFPLIPSLLWILSARRINASTNHTGSHTSFLRHSKTDHNNFDTTDGIIDLDAARSSFIQQHHLKPDTELDIHDFSLGQESFHVNGKTYYLMHLEQMKIYAEDATFSLDDEEMMKLNNEDSPIFVGEQNGDQVMVVRDQGDQQGVIESIVVMPKNGPEVYMESVAPNVLAVINAKDYHPEYSYLLNKLELKGRKVDNNDLDNSTRLHFESSSRKSRATRLTNSCSKYYVIKVATVFDSTFCDFSGSNWKNSKSKITALIANASLRYRRQGICTKVLMGKLDGFCNASTDPYADMVKNSKSLGCVNGGGMLTSFQNYYKPKHTTVDRGAAHLFFAQKPKDDIIGCAEIERLCPRYSSYAVINLQHFQAAGLRGILFAHELGHNIGLHHQNANKVNPRWIMRPNPGEGGGNYAFSGISRTRITMLFDEYWVKPQWGQCVKIELVEGGRGEERDYTSENQIVDVRDA